MGILSVMAGCLLLAFAPNSKRVAAASLLVSAISLALSWRVLPEGIERAQLARREFQNLPVREGEIELMQILFPYSSVAFFAVLLAVLYLCRMREDGAG